MADELSFNQWWTSDFPGPVSSMILPGIIVICLVYGLWDMDVEICHSVTQHHHEELWMEFSHPNHILGWFLISTSYYLFQPYSVRNTTIIIGFSMQYYFIQNYKTNVQCFQMADQNIPYFPDLVSVHWLCCHKLYRLYSLLIYLMKKRKLCQFWN